MRRNRIIIWSSCSAYVLLVTALVAYSCSLYGVLGLFSVLLISEMWLQLYKIVYEQYAKRGKYNLSHVINVTNCWIIYQILNMTLLTGCLFSYLIMLAEIEALNIPKSIWLIAIIALACVWSLRSIQPFVRKERYEGEKRRPTKLISSFAPRFVILYTFWVYYIVAYWESLATNFIPTLCVIYLGVDRLITMFNTVREYEQQEYYSLFRDTVKWIRDRKGM